MISDDLKLLKEHIHSIIQGKKIELIGDNDIVNAIDAYKDLLGLDDELSELSSIISNLYGREILIDNKNKVFENILKFNSELIPQIKSSFSEFNIDDDSQILNSISNKFNFLNHEFSLKLLNTLGYKTDYFLPENKIEKLVNQPIQIPQFQLHNFQKYIKDKSIDFLLNPEKSNKHLIHLPTGAGKTKTAMELISDFIRSKSVISSFDTSSTIIWIAHSTELCEQAFETFHLTWNLRGDSPINSIKFYEKFNLTDQLDEKIDSKIIFMTFGKIISAIKGNNPFILEISNKTDLVVIDEAHRSMAPEWNKGIQFFADNLSTQIIGLSATPGLGSDQLQNSFLSAFFDANKIGLSDNLGVPVKNPIKYLRDREYLAEIEEEVKFTNYELDIKKSDIERLKFGEHQLHGVLSNASINPQRNKILIESILKENKLNRKMLIFTCSLKHCVIIETLLKSYGIESKSITSKTSKISRLESIERFKNGDLNILLNFGVLTTGFDAPKINTVIIARPTLSVVLYSQMVGRGLRGLKNGGNKVNRLITLRDNLKHGNMDIIFNSFESVWKN